MTWIHLHELELKDRRMRRGRVGWPPDCCFLWTHPSQLMALNFSTLCLNPSLCKGGNPLSLRVGLSATMTISKSKIAIGFIVAGTAMLIFGIISASLGPSIMKHQIEKVSCITSYWCLSERSPGFDSLSGVYSRFLLGKWLNLFGCEWLFVSRQWT